MKNFKAKRVTVPFSEQARKAIRTVAGSMDETAADFLKDAIKDRLEEMK